MQVEEFFDEENIDGEAIVLRGLCRSRNRTNWLYRGTAMGTTDRMDIDELRWHVYGLETALAYISTTFASLAMAVRQRTQHNLPTLKMERAMDFLTVAVSWLVCSIELAFLNLKDKLYFVHHPHRFESTKLRTIEELEDDNHSTQLFGFKKEELLLLLLHWRIPSQFREEGYVFEGEAAMLIFLYYIRSGMTYTRMVNIFGGDPRRMTNYIRAVSDHLYKHFYHKISGDSMRMWVTSVDDFRQAIWDRLQDGLVNERSSDGTEVDWEVWIPPQSFRVFGWLDDTDLQTDRPRPGRNNESDELRDTQEAFYK